jgi:hypothetical protein
VELICTTCRELLDAGDGINTRVCVLCGATICREEARKAQVRIGDGPWAQQVVCKEWTACCVRHAGKVIR